MEKKEKRLLVIISVAVFIAIYLVGMLAQGGHSGFVGEWYWGDKLCFTFYSDGTCKVRGEYGTCQWDVVDGKLKRINVYSQTYATDYTLAGNKLIINGNAFIKK